MVRACTSASSRGLGCPQIEEECAALTPLSHRTPAEECAPAGHPAPPLQAPLPSNPPGDGVRRLRPDAQAPHAGEEEGHARAPGSERDQDSPEAAACAAAKGSGGSKGAQGARRQRVSARFPSARGEHRSEAARRNWRRGERGAKACRPKVRRGGQKR
eukprot:scaffold4562_cov255-Pinguiococcus_pyrenoidosus.AAC.23